MLPNAGMMKEKAVITVVALLKMKMKVMMVAMTVMMVAMQVKVKLTVMISMNQLRSLAQLIPVTKMIPAAMTMMISMNELTSLAQMISTMTKRLWSWVQHLLARTWTLRAVRVSPWRSVLAKLWVEEILIFHPLTTRADHHGK